MYLIGKSLYNKAVCLNPRHRKFDIVFTFDTSNEAKKFYESFNYKEKRLLKQRYIIRLCKHKSIHDLYVGSKTHHYKYCPNCKMAIFVDDETKEDKDKRRDEFKKMIEEDEIEQLKLDIEQLKNTLHLKEKELKRREAKLEGGLSEQENSP